MWCEGGVVYANDLTELGYCEPGSNEVVCRTGGERITEVLRCANGCATTERRYFDYHGDYSAFDRSSLCTP